MKKSVLKKLQHAATWLPKETEPAIVKMSGAQCIKSGAKVDKNGKPFVLKQMYDIPSKQPVNHVERMKKAYTTGGFDAVDLYLSKYKERIETLMKLPSNQKQTV